MMVDEKKFYVAMVRDVTEQKRFEKELAAEKESLAVTVRSIGDGVITTDVQGRIIMMNNEAERLTGWPSKEAMGKPTFTHVFFFSKIARSKFRLKYKGSGLLKTHIFVVIKPLRLPWILFTNHLVL